MDHGTGRFFGPVLLLERNVIIVNKLRHLLRPNPNHKRKPYVNFYLNTFVHKDTL